MINYQLLAEAQRFYSELGYQYVDLPWEIQKSTIELTLPPLCLHLAAEPTNGDTGLIGSAEQAFFQLRLDGKLPDGKYQAITPCFRHEVSDWTHHRTFMKLELIQISSEPLTYTNAHEVYSSAQQFFMHKNINIKTIETQESMYSRDIECANSGIELGSYGIRSHEDVGYWVYGTGIAEPRFSLVESIQNGTV